MDGKLRVLIADDDRAFAQALCLYMNGRPDLECIACVTNGRQALDLTRDRQPDAVVLDIGMPYMDGVDYLRELQLEPVSQRPAVYVVTACASVAVRRQVLELGARACLDKPYSLELLCERIRDGAQTQAETYEHRVRRVVMQVVLRFQISASGFSPDYMESALRQAILAGDNAWLMKDIIARIAESNNTSSENVERVLRSCLGAIYKKQSEELKDLLHLACCRPDRRMSCRNFLMYVSKAIRLKYNL